MAQERNDQESAYAVAVRSLKNELNLAVQLVRVVRAAGLGGRARDEAIEAARNAFRHAVDALSRIPHMEASDMEAIQRLMDDFRAALADLNQ